MATFKIIKANESESTLEMKSKHSKIEKNITMIFYRSQ